jgi:membrane protease subunit HflC
MSNAILKLVFIAVMGAVVLFATSIYTVNEWERGLKFQFGEFSGEEIQPGLNFKLPFVNTITKYGQRTRAIYHC